MLGLPPGVTIGDLLRQAENEKVMNQAYLLAQQANEINGHLQRFDRARIPESCRATVEAQISKLTSVRTIIWNTLISLAAGTITINDRTLEALIDRQAGEVMAMGEAEKLALALKMDSTSAWASEIEKLVYSERSDDSFSADEVEDAIPTTRQPAPLYDEPEGRAPVAPVDEPQRNYINTPCLNKKEAVPVCS